MSHDEDRLLEEVLRGVEGPEPSESSPDLPEEDIELWREYTELSGLLPFALEPIVPRVECRAEILDRIASQEGAAAREGVPVGSETALDVPLPFPTPAPAMHTRWALLALAAALMIAVLGLGSATTWLYRDHQRQADLIAEIQFQIEQSRSREELLVASQADYKRLRTLVTARRTRVCRLRPIGDQPAQPVARGLVYFDTERRDYFLSAMDLEPCEQGFAYRLWFIVDGRPVAGKTFHVKAGVPTALGSGGMPTGFTAMMVTYQRESAEGPEGERILYGDQAEDML